MNIEYILELKAFIIEDPLFYFDGILLCLTSAGRPLDKYNNRKEKSY